MEDAAPSRTASPSPSLSLEAVLQSANAPAYSLRSYERYLRKENQLWDS